MVCKRTTVTVTLVRCFAADFTYGECATVSSGINTF